MTEDGFTIEESRAIKTVKDVARGKAIGFFPYQGYDCSCIVGAYGDVAISMNGPGKDDKDVRLISVYDLSSSLIADVLKDMVFCLGESIKDNDISDSDELNDFLIGFSKI